MGGLTLFLSGLAFGVAAAALIAGERRHRRARRRSARMERALTEQLHLLKAGAAQSVAARLAAQGEHARMELALRSTQGEDLWLLELFNPPGRPVKTSGFYIECGGYDGLNKSVTWIFDALGWDGLLIEPLPDLAAAARANRPNARVEQTAVAQRGSTGFARFVHVRSDRRGEGSQGSSHLAGGEQGAVRGSPRDKAREIEVPLTCMDELLKDHSGAIDLVVLDVEGAEARVLDGFDLARFRPRVLMIEDHTLGREGESASELMRRLTPAGYRHVAWIGRNRLVIHGSETELLARAGALTQSAMTRAPSGA